jgi:hypothetical protein
MKQFLFVVAAVAAIVGAIGIGPAYSQAPPPGGGGMPDSQRTQPSAADGTLTQGGTQKVEDYLDRAHILKGRDPAKVRAEAQEESAKLAKAIDLNCEIVDAEPVGRGKTQVGGKSVALRVYEIACSNGLGYMVVSRGADAPYALSCFSADTTHAAQVAEGRTSDMYCQLPATKDVKAMAASLMSAAGTTCAVRNLKWFGRSAATQTEYAEVVCDDGKGYLLRTAQAGSSAETSVMSCQDAAKKGLKCRLTDAGPVAEPVTLETLKDALARNGVKCSVARIRLVGQESTRQRYVVEVQCPEHPDGLVAFIPLGENTNKFEAVNCVAAIDRHVVCEFTAK